MYLFGKKCQTNTLEEGNYHVIRSYHAVLDLIASAKSLAQSALANQNTTERSDLADQYEDLMDQIVAVAANSSYKDTNLLVPSNELGLTFDKSDDTTLTISGVDGTGGVALTAGAWDDAVAGADNINRSIDDLDAARDQLRIDSTSLSNKLSTITIRQDFTAKMINTLEDGATNLTNADLTEECANMLMLQTHQQLGTTSLSMAALAAQAVLKLF